MSELARSLVGRGVRVEAVTTAADIDGPTALEGEDFRLLMTPSRKRARDRAVDLFREERRGLGRLLGQVTADVVHAHWTYEFAWASLNARPLVVTAHDAPLTVLRHMPDAYRALRTVMAYRVRLASPHLTVVSPYLALKWRRQMLYRKRIPVVPNMVDPPRGAPAGHALPREAPVILDVSDEGRRKNVASLLRAMPLVLEAHPGARLRLAGPGLVEDSKLGTLAEQLDVRGSVEFLGVLDATELDDAYRGATIFVHPSLEESFGMTVAEAMAHGLPVVGGARAGGVPWVLGGCGVVVDVRDPTKIAGAICSLLGDRSIGLRLGEAAARRARATFAPASVVETWLDLYRGLATGRR